jgi:hypothetical protein
MTLPVQEGKKFRPLEFQPPAFLLERHAKVRELAL